MTNTSEYKKIVIEVPEACKDCAARTGGICGHLSAKQLALLERYSIRTNKTTHEFIIPQGSEIKNHSNILEGVVKLTKTLPDGRQQIVGLQFPTDFLGSPFAGEHTYNAEAAGDVKLCTFPTALLVEMLKETPEIEHKLHKQALAQLEEARDMMLTLGRKTAMEKVASFIYMLAVHLVPNFNDKAISIQFEIPLSRNDIADYLGLTTETVSRNMTKLRKGRIIDVDQHRYFTIPDLRRLRHHCES